VDEFLRNFVIPQAPLCVCKRSVEVAIWLLLSCAHTSRITSGSITRHVATAEAFQFPRSHDRFPCCVKLSDRLSQKNSLSTSNHRPHNDETSAVVSRVSSEHVPITNLWQIPNVTRKDVVHTLALVGFATPLTTPNGAVNAFEGGIGGLGKTKPATRIVLWNEDSSPVGQDTSTGQISAELKVAGQPVLVSNVAPWPRRTGSPQYCRHRGIHLCPSCGELYSAGCPNGGDHPIRLSRLSIRERLWVAGEIWRLRRPFLHIGKSTLQTNIAHGYYFLGKKTSSASQFR
jgi:hypothetical protein